MAQQSSDSRTGCDENRHSRNRSNWIIFRKQLLEAYHLGGHHRTREPASTRITSSRNLCVDYLSLTQSQACAKRNRRHASSDCQPSSGTEHSVTDERVAGQRTNKHEELDLQSSRGITVCGGERRLPTKGGTPGRVTRKSQRMILHPSLLTAAVVSLTINNCSGNQCLSYPMEQAAFPTVSIHTLLRLADAAAEVPVEGQGSRPEDMGHCWCWYLLPHAIPRRETMRR